MVVIFHACWCHFHETPCVQHHNVFLKGHAVICMWGHGCWVSYKMKFTKGITIFTNTIFMRHLDVIPEWNIFLPARFCLSGNLWMNNIHNKISKKWLFLQTVTVFHDNISETNHSYCTYARSTSDCRKSLAWQSHLESWNVNYFHSSYNCLSSSAFIEESDQNSRHSFWIKIKACHWEIFHFISFFCKCISFVKIQIFFFHELFFKNYTL